MEHKNITGANNHEPKGVESASSGQVYTANGLGSGSWTAPASSGKVVVSGRLDDISAPSSIYMAAPVAGTITAVIVTLQTGVTVANSIVTGEIAGVPIGGLSITVTQAASAAGSVYSDTTISGSNTVTVGSPIRIITDGGSTTTAIAHISVVITV